MKFPLPALAILLAGCVSAPVIVFDPQAIQIAENKRKSASGEDTNLTRLLALQATLDKTLALLRQAPAEAKPYFEQSIADFIRARTSLVQGIDYLNTHPESNQLTVPRDPDAIDRVNSFGYGWIAQGLWPSHLPPDVQRQFQPILDEAGFLLSSGFHNFMGEPFEGIASLGEIGGYRDIILRDVAVAEATLGKSNRIFLGVVKMASDTIAQVAYSPFASTSAPTNPSRISGTVVRTDGKPAYHAVIRILPVDSPIYKAPKIPDRRDLNSRPMENAIPCTITDENGGFMVRSLLPGYYCVTVGFAEYISKSWRIIEVKEGVDTQMTDPLMLESVTF